MDLKVILKKEKFLETVIEELLPEGSNIVYLSLWANWEIQREKGSQIDPVKKAARDLLRINKENPNGDIGKAFKEIGEDELLERYAKNIREEVDNYPQGAKAFVRGYQDIFLGYSEEVIESNIRRIMEPKN